MKNLAIAVFAALIFLGCASTDKPGVSTATIYFSFAPDPDPNIEWENGAAIFETVHGKWKIEKAQVVFGSIGLHWDAPYTGGGVSRMPRHDNDGQTRATTIIGFFAVDLLQEQFIQELQVEPRVFNHVHKEAFNSDTLSKIGRTVDGINLEKFSELKKGRTFYFSGEAYDSINGWRRFELYTTDTNFVENDFKSVLFDKKEIFENDVYAFKLSPILRHNDYDGVPGWFGTIRIPELRANDDGLIVINDRNSTNVTNQGRFITRFTAYHSMYLDIEKL